MSREDYIYPNQYGISIPRRIYLQQSIYNPRKYDYLSRYNNTDRLFDDVNGVYYHSRYEKKTIPTSNADVYTTVDLVSENRLDIIAHKYYGYSLYWWIIAIANDIIDPFNIPIGTVLRIPPLSALYDKGSVLG